MTTPMELSVALKKLQPNECFGLSEENVPKALQASDDSLIELMRHSAAGDKGHREPTHGRRFTLEKLTDFARERGCVVSYEVETRGFRFAPAISICPQCHGHGVVKALKGYVFGILYTGFSTCPKCNRRGALRRGLGNEPSS